MDKSTIKRLMFLALLVSVVYATTSGAQTALYNCCGNEESKMENECRYTNRDTTCGYDADCKGDTYGACCPDGC